MPLVFFRPIGLPNFKKRGRSQQVAAVVSGDLFVLLFAEKPGDIIAGDALIFRRGYAEDPAIEMQTAAPPDRAVKSELVQQINLLAASVFRPIIATAEEIERRPLAMNRRTDH